MKAKLHRVYSHASTTGSALDSWGRDRGLGGRYASDRRNGERRASTGIGKLGVWPTPPCAGRTSARSWVDELHDEDLVLRERSTEAKIEVMTEPQPLAC